MKLVGARQAIHDATAFKTAPEGGTRRRYPSGAIANMIEAGTILEAVDYPTDKKIDRLNKAIIRDWEPVRHWLYWAYAAPTWNSDENHGAHVYSELASLCAFEFVQFRTAKRRRAFYLIPIVALDKTARYRSLREVEQPLKIDLPQPIIPGIRSAESMAKALGVSPSNWVRDGWSDVVNMIASHIEDWDQRGITRVAKRIKDMEEGMEGGKEKEPDALTA